MPVNGSVWLRPVLIKLVLNDDFIETALSDFRNSTFWHSKSGEALCRTPIDMILFDRLSLQQNEHGARNLIFLRERPITATVLDKKRMISGVADYVIGYDYASCDGSNVNLEYTLVVIEAKKGTILPKGRAQVAVYLGTSKNGLFDDICFSDYDRSWNSAKASPGQENSGQCIRNCYRWAHLRVLVPRP